MQSRWLSAALGGALLAASGAGAQDGPNTNRTADAEIREQAALREATHTRELADSVLAAREAASGRRFSPALRASLTQKLSSAPLASLEAFANAGGLGDIDALLREAGSPRVLGASAADLVFTPVAPCRIINTTVAGGPIAANTTRNFFVNGSTAGTFEGQGGTAGGCGIPDAATAVAINFVAVGPAGPGDLRAFPWNATPSVPNASVINFSNLSGLNIANGVIQPVCNAATTTCTFDLIVQADVAQSHLVADVVGYFASANRSEVAAFKAGARSTNVALTTTAATMNTLAVTFPGPGQAVITVQAEFDNNTAGNYLDCQLLDGATQVTRWDWDAGDDADGWYDLNQSTTVPVTIAAAGTKNYSFTCRTNAGTANAFYAQMFATFFGATLP